MSLNIKFIGFDSMGTRGMATVVDIKGFKIFIDPGVSYAPRRYGLPPHPLEEEALANHLEQIHREIIDSHVIVISHYHRDHYLYREDENEYYRGKVLIVKNYEHNINASQRIRAYILFKKQGVKDIAKEVLIADGNSYEYEGITLKFSNPLPHGPRNTKLGYVVMTLIVFEDYKILHASDVQGPIDDEAYHIIVSHKPDLLIISGPPTYFEGYKIGREDVSRGLKNLLSIVENMSKGSTVVVDHHLLRDLNYRERINEVIKAGDKRGVRVITAAEYMGFEVKQLEALRKQLWMETNR